MIGAQCDEPLERIALKNHAFYNLLNVSNKTMSKMYKIKHSFRVFCQLLCGQRLLSYGG